MYKLKPVLIDLPEGCPLPARVRWRGVVPGHRTREWRWVGQDDDGKWFSGEVVFEEATGAVYMYLGNTKFTPTVELMMQGMALLGNAVLMAKEPAE